MAAKNPTAWFPGYGLASIRQKKVDKHAQRRAAKFPQMSPYFDSWLEAYQWLQAKAVADLARSAKRMEADRRHLERVLVMTPPPQPQERADAA